MIIELRCQTVLKRHLSTRPRDLDAAHAALNEEDAHLIAGDRNVDLLILLL